MSNKFFFVTVFVVLVVVVLAKPPIYSSNQQTEMLHDVPIALDPAIRAGESDGRKKTKVETSIAGSDIQTAADFECPEEFGYYPVPGDCTKYYVCVFGDALLESCTGGLAYSPELQTCDWSRNVNCKTGTGGRVDGKPPIYSSNQQTDMLHDEPIALDPAIRAGGDTGVEGLRSKRDTYSLTSTGIHFSAYLTTSWCSGSNNVITYNGLNVNEGNAMNAATGVFTAPKKGIYQFQFNAVTNVGVLTQVYLQVNEITRTGTMFYDTTIVQSSGTFRHAMTTGTIVSLNVGDKVRIFFKQGCLIDTSSDMVTQFYGSLLKELI